jgi:hypothetical protein
MDNPELGKVQVYEVAARSDNVQYTVVYLDYPDRVVEAAIPDVLLENVFKQVVKENPVTSQVPTTSDGYPALVGEYQMGRQGYARYKSVLAGNRIYQAIALTPDDSTNTQDATRFIDSFKLLSPAAAVTPTRPGRATPTSSSVDPGDWTPVTSDAGEFSVLMPTNPRTGTQNTTTANNVELTLYTFVSTEGSAEYTLVYVDYPDEVIASGDPQTLLGNAFNGVHGTNAVEVEDAITVQGNPGLYGEFDSSSGYAWYKAVLRGNRLYQLIVIAPDKATAQTDAARYLDSFQITGGAIDEPTPGAVEPTPGTTGNMSGMTGLNNTVRFTVTDIEYNSGQGEILKPEAGNEYLYLTITIENTGTEEEHISTAFATIVDSEGNEHDATFNVSFEDMLNVTVEPGTTVEGTMAFEIPQDATGLTFNYDPPLADNTLRIQLDR